MTIRTEGNRTSKLIVEIDYEKHKKLKIEAIKNGMTLKDYVLMRLELQ